MKVFILTCVDENCDLIFCKAYRSPKEAKDEMTLQFNEKKAEPSRIDYANINDASADIGNEYYGFVWQITEDEL